jgi:hypothetical protein
VGRFTLHTYENLDEFNQFYEELGEKVEYFHNFIFGETENLLTDEEPVIIDISSLVENIQRNPDNRQHAIHNLINIHEDCTVIIISELANQALQYFPLIFDKTEPLFEKSDETDVEDDLIPFQRRTLYTYKNGLDLEKIIDYADKNEIPFTNFAKLNGPENKRYRSVSSDDKKTLMDITTVVKAAKNNEIAYIFEQFSESFPFYDAIVRDDVSDEALETFRTIFSPKKPISELLDGISFSTGEIDKESEDKVIKVVDLNDEELNNFYDALNSQLFGHDLFKINFKSSIDNFILLNRINEKKIFSIFLLGNSGLGKTEVARIIKNSLNKDTKLIKISFGNYSSQDSLNSLIGSPRGYIGSESGELSEKLDKSKAGIILCDEFEKTTRPVFNFFLELLEEGFFTDRMSREYDLNGYIIVFTSNINEEQFLKDIPPELRSRFDIVNEFGILTRGEKIEFLEHQIKIFSEKIQAQTDSPLFTESEIESFKEIVDTSDNLRDIQRTLQNRMLNKLKKHEDASK